MWQRKIVKTINELCEKNTIDIVHHVTWATYILPLALHKCKHSKVIIGPVGGGESIPHNVNMKISVKNRIIEGVRTTLATIAPYVLNHKTIKSATLIYATTEETKKRLPKRYWEKIRIMQSIGAEDGRINTNNFSSEDKHEKLKVLMVGWFLYWEGIDIGLQAVKELIEEGYDLELTVVGDGKENFMHDYEDISGIVWHKHVDYHKMDRIYDDSDVLLNCSLHDSGCMVILEAMSRQLPIICIDAGGPKVLTDDQCAIKISPDTMEKMNSAIKDAILSAIKNRDKFRTMGLCERQRVASKFLYSQKYKDILYDYEKFQN